MTVLINPYRSGAGGGASSYYQSLTVDHTKLGSSDLTNYPALVSLTDAHLKSVANGGHVDNVGVNNIWFASTSSGTSADKIPFEIRKWDATTGQLIAWVKASSLSHTSDTLFGYLRYGDPAQTSDLSNGTGVYDSNFWTLMHAGKNGSLDPNDSSANGFGSSTFGSPTATTGKIDTGVSFSGSEAYRVFHLPTGLTAYNTSLWWNANASPGAGTSVPILQMSDGSDSIGFCWSNAGGAAFRHMGYMQNSSNAYQLIQTATSLVGSTWYLLTLEWDGSTFTVYVNGAADGTPISVASLRAFTGGSYMKFGPAEAGKMEEMRFSTAARGASWIKADYNNQNSPSTFVTFGTETAI